MKRDTTSQVPAVVVGGGINGLGVLRSLARAGVPVILLDSDARHPGMRSRYGRKVFYRNDCPEAVIIALERLASTLAGERPALFLTQEETVSSVSVHRERLLPLYRFTLPTHDLLAPLLHKDGFRAVAEGFGAAVPRMLRITTVQQVAKLHALRPPLVVKPSFRHAGYASAFCKAYRVETVDEAQAVVRDILPTLSDVVVQEWIEGADSDIFFCLQYIARSGEIAASFVGRKIRSWPPQVGGTARCAPAPKATAAAEAALADKTAEFFRYAGVIGFASMEYKRDAYSGEFLMVEPTVGRTDYQEEVATLNGVNIPLFAYRTELELPQVSATSVSQVRVWRDRAADRRSAILAAGIKPWQPSRARIVDALWRLSDPMPAAGLLAERVALRARRMIRATRRTRNSNRSNL